MYARITLSLNTLCTVAYGSRWKAAKEAGTDGAIADLSLKDKTGAEIEKRLPGGKVKKKQKAEVVLETSTRSKKKSVTTVQGTSTSIKLHCFPLQTCV